MKIVNSIIFLLTFAYMSYILARSSLSHFQYWAFYDDFNRTHKFGDVIVLDNDSYTICWPYLFKYEEKVAVVIFCFYDKLVLYAPYNNDKSSGICEFVGK